MTHSAAPSPSRKIPIYLRVLIGVVLGSVLGVFFETRPILFGVHNDDLGQLGLLVIRLLKALAVPLILFAILDAFVRTNISARSGGRLVLICLVNVTVAMTIGLLLMNTLRPGNQWRGRMDNLQSLVQSATHAPLPAVPGSPPPASSAAPAKPSDAAKPTLDPLKNIAGYVPESLVDPFVKNNVISVVLLALLLGAALRRVRQIQQSDGENSIAAVEQFVQAGYQILIQMLEWVVQAVPFAVFGVVAQVVGKTGLGIFSVLGIFLVTVLVGLLIHSLIYYPLVAWLVGKKTPKVYLGGGADAIIMGLSINSSLATVPTTLRCLTQRMGISEQSARMAACVGTNLNNDGVTLYEAVTALFLAQALGLELGLQQQIIVVLASIMAGIGIAGIPEAGLVVLPLVLGAAGLPEGAVAAAIPLIIPVDWIIARVRSGVNVMSDMLVAILLDVGAKPGTGETPFDDSECGLSNTVAAMTPP